MIERLYRALWTRIGGRPWTYIIRENPRLAAIVGAVSLAIAIVSLVAPKPLALTISAGIGFILGHIFW